MRIGMVRIIIGTLLALSLEHAFSSESDSGKIYFRFNYFTAPKYSIDSLNFSATRSEFSLKKFYPAFRDMYGKRYGNEAIDKAENWHMWANVMAVPAGILLGIGLGKFITGESKLDATSGPIFCLASSPFLAMAFGFDVKSFKVIREGSKLGHPNQPR